MIGTGSGASGDFEGGPPPHSLGRIPSGALISGSGSGGGGSGGRGTPLRECQTWGGTLLHTEDALEQVPLAMRQRRNASQSQVRVAIQL